MTDTKAAPKHRTAKQIVTTGGVASKTDVTGNLWVSDPGRFADKTEGNAIRAFTTGREYFADLLTAIATAETQVLIAGWQVGWDALLAPKVRLYDALFNAASKNPRLKIYVMPWDDHEPLQTYDDQVKAALSVINYKLGRTQVFVQLSPTYASVNAGYYAHHQKHVVIDRKIAYVGGMDVSYGRFCDEHYTLQADADGRDGLNRYNGCVVQVGKMDPSKLADPDNLVGAWDRIWNVNSTRDHIHNGGMQPKYETAGKAVAATNAGIIAEDTVDPTTLDPTIQPRMPWQDVHCRIEGPAVSDLMRNFVSRWNIEAPSKQKLEQAPPHAAFPKVGQVQIQVLRSAPANHCQKEYDALPNKQGIKKPAGTQKDILSAMLTLIDKSRRFIYIENQFFVSNFGRESTTNDGLSGAGQFIASMVNGEKAPFYDLSQNTWADLAADFDNKSKWQLSRHPIDTEATHAPPVNGIVSALLARIRRSALSNSLFHVYITLPVHSEGSLSDGVIAVQIYWTMQTISFGSQSLLNGIRRIIKARDLKIAKDPNFERAFNDQNSEYNDIDIERCNEFVTLLNLRNWLKLPNGNYVTEQIYVHSKIMVTDDQYAIIGSANINDRSLLGERDSELAVLVMDEETLRADVNGAGSNREVRKFAHQLRIDLWRKIFGFTDGVRPALELQKAIEEPGAKGSWALIQKRAEANAIVYEKAFGWIPRSFTGSGGTLEYGHILPTWRNTLEAPKGASWTRGNISAPLPFQQSFWKSRQYVNNNVSALSSVRGFIAALPTGWTKGENLKFAYPTSLVADNEKPRGEPGDEFAATGVPRAPQG